MPVVPTVAAPTVTPAGETGIPYQTGAGATPQAFGAGIGQAEQGLGQEVEKFGDVLAKHALKMQEDLNISDAKDLFLKGDIEVGKLTVDYNQLEGKARVDAYPKYVQDLQATRDRLKAEAPNNDVSRRFDQDFARRVGYSVVDGARGAATANKAYQRETTNAVRANGLSAIAQNSQDDGRFEGELKAQLDNLRTTDEYKFAPPEMQEQLDRNERTAAWGTRLASMAKNEPLRARELLKQHKGELEGGKALQLEDTINQQIINVQTRVDSDNIIQSGALVPKDLKEAVKKFEGYSEKPYSDYKQTSSGYGTKAQPGDENIPPEQRKAVYEARLDSELARAANIVDQFAPGLPDGTRKALISLTYNAGSAWTSAGLGQAIKAGDTAKAADLFQQYNKAGGETNPALVTRRDQEVSWFGGESHGSGDFLAEAMSHAKEAAIKAFPDDPGNQAKYLDTLQSRIRADASVMQTSARQIQLDNRNAVQSELVRDQQPPTSYDQLSPKAQQAYDLSPPSQQAVFNRQFRQNATRDVPLTPERQQLYDQLYGESRNEPEKFMSRNVSELDLPRAQKSRLSAMQADRQALLNKGTKLSGAMTELQGLLNDAGIGKSATDTAKNAEYNKFSGVLEKRIEAFQDDKKRPPTGKEIREMGTELLRDTVTSKGMLWDTHARAYQAIADKTPVTVNSADEARALPSGTTFVLNGETRTRK
jgi:GH24 family phage-related lysozyme (muramidase)